MATDWQKFRWLYFGWRGAIDRKTFIHGWLLLVTIELAIFSQLFVSGADANSGGFWAVLLAIFGGISAIAMLFLAAKRLRDTGWPPLIALALVIPALSRSVRYRAKRQSQTMTLKN